MNLLFWKKKTGAGEEAENAQEPLDSATTKQDVAERNPGSPEPETPSPETMAKPGLAARMKLRLIGLTRHFKKAPVFHAEEGPAPEAPGASGATPEEEHPEDIPDARSIRSRKRLIIGGAIGLLVLLLVGIGIAIWPASTPPRERLDAGHEVTATSAIQPEHTPQPESAPANTQTEIEALKKENAELQVRIEALKKQQPPSQAAHQAGGSASSSSIGGEVRVGNEDPKAAAMSLKEAIEAMNASSGDYKKKPAK